MLAVGLGEVRFRVPRGQGALFSPTFPKYTPNTLVNSSCLVDSGLPSTRMRNLGHADRNSDGGGRDAAGLLALSPIVPSRYLFCRQLRLLTLTVSRQCN